MMDGPRDGLEQVTDEGIGEDVDGGEPLDPNGLIQNDGEGTAGPGPVGATITALAADGGFANTVGYYLKDDTGGIADAGVLFADVGDAIGGEGVRLAEAARGDLGLFLVRDGANLGIDWDDGDVAFENGRLVHTASNGTETKVAPWQVFFTDEVLNPDGTPHALESQPDEGPDVAFYEWEDKNANEGSYDGDFNDAKIEVSFEPPTMDGGSDPLI